MKQDDPRRELARLAARERAARTKLEQARDAVDLEMARLRDQGVTWAAVAEVARVPLETARSRVEKPEAVIKKVRQDTLATLPGLPLSEAAARLGTSPAQVARMISDGRLTELHIEGRARRRVATDGLWDVAVRAAAQKSSKGAKRTRS